jgi:hypothetical protein
VKDGFQPLETLTKLSPQVAALDERNNRKHDPAQYRSPQDQHHKEKNYFHFHSEVGRPPATAA